MSELTKRLRESQVHLLQRAFRDQCGSPDCAISASIADEAADRIEALEDCLREMLDAQRNDADYVRFDAALEKARALLEEK